MNSHLDIPTIGLLSSILSLLFAVTMVFVYKTTKTYPGFRSWTIGFLFSCIGMVLFSLRCVIPEEYPLFIGNLFITCFYMMIDHGVREFVGRKGHLWYRFYLPLLLLQTAGLLFFTYLFPNTPLRLLFHELIIICVFANLFYQTVRYVKPLLKNRCNLLPVATLLYIFILAFHGFYSVFNEPNDFDIIAKSTVQGMVFAGFVVAKTLLAMSLLILTAQRFASDLMETQHKVVTLEGLLPVCSHCKKIRDDNGYWDDVDTYLDHHSDIRISHGLCPDCHDELYPDLDMGDE